MHQVVQSNRVARTQGSRHAVLPTGQMTPFLLTTAIFFLWGMSNNLTDILVQQFKKSFELSLMQAQLVQTAEVETVLLGSNIERRRKVIVS